MEKNHGPEPRTLDHNSSNLVSTTRAKRHQGGENNQKRTQHPKRRMMSPTETRKKGKNQKRTDSQTNTDPTSNEGKKQKSLD